MKPTEQGDSYPSGSDRNGAGRRHVHRLEERAIGLFLLGVVLFNPLMVSVFDRGPEVELMGIPLLFIFVFCAWTLLIMLLACTVEARSSSEGQSLKDEPRSFEPPSESP